MQTASYNEEWWPQRHDSRRWGYCFLWERMKTPRCLSSKSPTLGNASKGLSQLTPCPWGTQAPAGATELGRKLGLLLDIRLNMSQQIVSWVIASRSRVLCPGMDSPAKGRQGQTEESPVKGPKDKRIGVPGKSRLGGGGGGGGEKI